MNADKLIKMANDIGRFFASNAETEMAQEQARFGIADHIKRFWDPRMRRALLGAVAAGEAASLDAMVATALRQHHDLLMPKS
jgi:formate dehydrogenase subunit delta